MKPYRGPDKLPDGDYFLVDDCHQAIARVLVRHDQAAVTALPPNTPTTYMVFGESWEGSALTVCSVVDAYFRKRCGGPNYKAFSVVPFPGR